MRYSISALLLVAWLPSIATAEQPSVSPAPASPVRQLGAVGDGAADDTDAIQRAVDAGTGELCLPAGIYRITRPIVIELDRVGPTSFSGGGTARIVMAGPGPALKFVGTHEGTADPPSVKPNVWQRQRMPCVDGLEIVGDHAEAVGIEAAGTMQLTITRTLIRHTLHAVHLVKRNRNVIVSACHFYDNRGVGVYLDDVSLHQINVTGCHISYNAGGGIVSRAGNVRNLQVAGCDIEANMAPDGPPTANVFLDATGGNYGTAEAAITGSTLQHSSKCPGSANVRLVGCDQANRRWGNLTIADNVLSDVEINVDLRGARGVTVTGNTFWGAVKQDLRVEESSNVVVGANVLDRNPGYANEGDYHGGLVFLRSEDCTLTGLHVDGVWGAEAGVILDQCRRFHLTGCTILDCDRAGVLLRNVTASRLSDCLIRNDRPGAAPWQAIEVVGGSGNAIAADK